MAERALSFLRALSMIIVWQDRCRAIFTRRESHSLMTVLIDDVVVGYRLVLGVGEEIVHWVLV